MNNIKHLLKCIRSNIVSIKNIYIMNENGEDKLYTEPSIKTIDELLTKNIKYYGITFKSDRSWIFKYLKNQLEISNNNNELEYLDIYKDKTNNKILFKIK